MPDADDSPPFLSELPWRNNHNEIVSFRRDSRLSCEGGRILISGNPGDLSPQYGQPSCSGSPQNSRSIPPLLNFTLAFRQLDGGSMLRYHGPVLALVSQYQ